MLALLNFILGLATSPNAMPTRKIFLLNSLADISSLKEDSVGKNIK